MESPWPTGVTVIAAHCGTRSARSETDFVPTFMRMAREHERFFGDTAALNLWTRWYAWPTLLNDQVIRNKLVHGSDWPIISLPRPKLLGLHESMHLMAESNWLRRDVLIKKALGLTEPAYWNRAATLLRLDTDR